MPDKIVLHIVGSQCSGKSHLLREVKSERPEIEVFCIAENFYKPQGVMNQSYNINWKKYRQKIDELPKVVAEFIASNKYPVIESTGTNKVLQAEMQKHNVITVAIESPDDYDLEWRCKERNLKFSESKKIRAEYEKTPFAKLDYDSAKKTSIATIKQMEQAKALSVEPYDPTIEEIMEHREKLRNTDWKSDEFWQMHLNGFDPYADDEGFEFHKDIAISVIEFWESNFVHSSAEWFEKPFQLEPFQKQFVGHFFGWKYKSNGLRRFREALLYVPRKNGKTPLGVCMALIMYRFDGEMGAEVYVMAADKAQAGIAYGDAVFNADRVDDMDDVKQYRALKSMEHAETNSIMRVMSSDADTKHGYRPSCYIIDELHVQKKEDLMEVMETGTAARRQPAAFYITTADFDHPSPCNEKLDYALKVRDGALSDPEFFPVVYMAGENDDWKDERTWMKANPNYGVSLKKSYMAKKARKAESNPRFLNTFKRLNLNIKTGQAVRWLSPDDWKQCAAPEVDEADLLGMECYGGIDLASKSDLCAFTLYFPEIRYFWHRFWVPEAQIKNKIEYQIWQKSGHLIGTKGNTTDYTFIQSEVITAAENFDVIDIAYDPFNASHFVMELAEYDNIPMVEFRQTMRYFNEPAKMYEELLLNHTMRHDNNPVINWMAGNVEVKEDPEGNFRPVKPRRNVSAKVDGIIADVMAFGVSINDDLENQFVKPIVGARETEDEDEQEEVDESAGYSPQEAMDNDDLW